jgi:hypothetical protein
MRLSNTYRSWIPQDFHLGKPMWKIWRICYYSSVMSDASGSAGLIASLRDNQSSVRVFLARMTNVGHPTTNHPGKPAT